MIKPHIVKEKKIGEVLSMIEKAGFIIKKMHLEQLCLEDAEIFYDEHQGKPFFKTLCTIMTSGPIVALLLEKPDSKDVVADFRKFIGATNPKDATPETVRAKYGNSLDENAIHGSDSDESAMAEAEFFFWDGDECDDEEDECCAHTECCK